LSFDRYIRSRFEACGYVSLDDFYGFPRSQVRSYIRRIVESGEGVVCGRGNVYSRRFFMDRVGGRIAFTVDDLVWRTNWPRNSVVGVAKKLEYNLVKDFFLDFMDLRLIELVSMLSKFDPWDNVFVASAFASGIVFQGTCDLGLLAKLDRLFKIWYEGYHAERSHVRDRFPPGPYRPLIVPIGLILRGCGEEGFDILTQYSNCGGVGVLVGFFSMLAFDGYGEEVVLEKLEEVITRDYRSYPPSFIKGALLGASYVLRGTGNERLYEVLKSFLSGEWFKRHLPREWVLLSVDKDANEWVKRFLETLVYSIGLLFQGSGNLEVLDDIPKVYRGDVAGFVLQGRVREAIDYFQDKVEEYPISFGIALWKTGSREAFDMLKEKLFDEDGDIRLDYLESLSLIFDASNNKDILNLLSKYIEESAFSTGKKLSFPPSEIIYNLARIFRGSGNEEIFSAIDKFFNLWWREENGKKIFIPPRVVGEIDLKSEDDYLPWQDYLDILGYYALSLGILYHKTGNLRAINYIKNILENSSLGSNNYLYDYELSHIEEYGVSKLYDTRHYFGLAIGLIIGDIVKPRYEFPIGLLRLDPEVINFDQELLIINI